MNLPASICKHVCLGLLDRASTHAAVRLLDLGCRGLVIAILQWTFQLARHAFAFSRRVSPEFCASRHALFEKRAQGRPGAGRHPRSAARNAHAGRTAQQHTGEAEHTAFPARWSDGLCRALPGAELSFWPPSPRRKSPVPRRLTLAPHPPRLDRSNDGQDHTVLPYAPAPFVQRGLRKAHGDRLNPSPRPASHIRDGAMRPPQPDPRLVTTYDRPFSLDQGGRSIRQIRISVKQNLCSQVD